MPFKNKVCSIEFKIYKNKVQAKNLSIKTHDVTITLFKFIL